MLLKTSIPESPNLLLSYCLIEELLRLNIDTFFFSPGLRNSAIASILQDNKLKTYTYIDERQAAFAALGYGIATNTPACLICTSGTATANYLPAIIEANLSNVPILILTCDVPHEDKNKLDLQSIDQLSFFKNYVAYQADLPATEIDPQIPNLLSVVDQAVFKANHYSKPVQINIAFRKPFTSEITNPNLKQYFQENVITSIPKKWLNNNLAYTQYLLPKFIQNNIDELVSAINVSSNPCIIVGGRIINYLAIEKFAEELNIPIFADVLSNLRTNNFSLYGSYYQQLDTFDLVIQFGYPVVNNSFFQHITNKSFLVLITEKEYYQDPGNKVGMRIVSDLPTLFEQIKSFLINKVPNHKIKFLEKQAQDKYNSFSELSEISALDLIKNYLSEDLNCFLSNSLIIREADLIFNNINSLTKIAANRGASGIDGIISSSIGYSIGLNKEVLCVIGDIATLHDLSAFNLLEKSNVRLIIFNNFSGNIFNLPKIKKEAGSSLNLIETSHDNNFEKISLSFNISYTKAQSLLELEKSLENKTKIIEICFDKELTIKQFNDF